MTAFAHQLTIDPEVTWHPSGDLILPIILDPAVAAQIRNISEQWGNARLSDTVTDLVLVGLMSVLSTARAS
ncbi:hypothetical protein LNAOJCKE_1591 [Methylorubrum aminovorans]|uniref:Uncharacterized protein n=1 Tax=Methylorubrum aminovorans TaxID=269069 RepID=A0ABQ4UD43_9HYPH|nr:hypothetical protein [Methylorubrum aminovorans]GJE64387.1 hypothetical protein LNAOJCKE_1591 [Methylorubrum aminovorans]GMA76184.1 hypothetical protein GCM10025880_26010 [Methylorubrum aminovorans]